MGSIAKNWPSRSEGEVNQFMKSTSGTSGYGFMGFGQKDRKVVPERLFAATSQGRTSLQVSAKGAIFAQGDLSESVFYLRRGTVKLTVLSSSGKEATIGILGEGDFFGEGSLSGQPFRQNSAIAMTDCSIVRIDKKTMLAALHRDQEFSDAFVGYLLERNIRYEEDLVDQIFNSSEKRLVRILLLLAHFANENATDHLIPEISQATLAGMVGTTRPRINFFMNKLRKQGYIEYDGGLRVHSSLLKVLLEE
jgi:CRP/FNR family cyclic AMP-dependent transcriptional regulator